MQKTRWFVNLKEPSKRIEKRYGVPYNTALGWQKKQMDESDYRGYLFDQLAMYITLEDRAVQKIKNYFQKNELQAIWGSLKSTMITPDLVFSDALSFGFKDYCIYESEEASQFAGNLDLFARTVSAKIDSLTEFEKFVLLNFVRSDEIKEYIFGE